MKIATYAIHQQATSKYKHTETHSVSSGFRTVVVKKQKPQRNQWEKEAIQKRLLERAEAAEEKRRKAYSQLSERDKELIQIIRDFIQSFGKKKRVLKPFAPKGKTEEIENINKSLQKNSYKEKEEEVETEIRREAFITHSHRIHEKESMDFYTSGTVTTSDGKKINYQLTLSMEREYTEEKTSTVTFKDPLVFNLDGKGISFSNKKLHIDLDLDGTKEAINWLNSGNGFLVHDKNSNGIVDDGSELFGPQTGRGFNELATYDETKDGWIDENDSIFDSLQIWTMGDDGTESLIGLKEANIGAIYLPDVESHYTLKKSGETVGRITHSSTYLKEDGSGAGRVHEIDYLI